MLSLVAGVGLSGFGGVPAFSQSLSRAIDTAISQRPVIAAAKSRHQAAVDRIDVARSGFRPQVNVEAGGGYEVTSNSSTRAQVSGGSEDLSRYDVTFGASQLLFDNGGTRSRTEAARSFAEAEQYGIVSAEEQLSFDVTQVYLSVILSQRLLNRANENHAALKRISTLVDALVESGRAREADNIQVRGRIAAAREEIIRRQRDIDERRAQFLEVVGENPRSLEQPKLARGQLPGTVEQALDLAQRVNPFLKGASSRERAVEAEARATEEPFLPRLTFDVIGTFGENLGGVRGVDNSVSAQFRLRYPLYSGGRDSAERRRAVHLVGVAQQERGEIAREVREAIRRSFARLQGDRLRIPPLAEQVEDAAKVADAYLAQFELGRRSLFDLLDSQTDYFRSQVALDEVLILALQDEFELLATVGSLQQTLTIAAK